MAPVAMQDAPVVAPQAVPQTAPVLRPVQVAERVSLDVSAAELKGLVRGVDYTHSLEETGSGRLFVWHRDHPGEVAMVAEVIERQRQRGNAVHDITGGMENAVMLPKGADFDPQGDADTLLAVAPIYGG